MEQNKTSASASTAALELYEYPFSLESCEFMEATKPSITTNPICRNYIFEYIVKGKGTLICNDKVYHLDKGDLFIIHKGSNFQYFPNASDPWSKIRFTADGILVSNLIVSYGLYDSVLIKGFNSEKLFRDMLDIWKNKGTANTMLSASMKLHEILQRAYLTQNKNIPRSNAVAIKRILDSSLYKANFSMKDITKVLGISKAQIINIFRAKYGQTPYKYFIEQRIQVSASMLLNTDMSIKEIADSLHFSDQHYYANVFKKLIGVTPNQYRKDRKQLFESLSSTEQTHA